MDANQALVLVPAGPPTHRPVRTALADPPPASEQSETSDSRLAGVSSPARETTVQPHQVMLSYNWGDKTATGSYDVQELVKCIAAELRRNNLTVWMDVDFMNGVVIDTMAGAVKNCQVFVPVVTAKYQDSPNCKLEFDYAVALKKCVVPVYAVNEAELQADGIHMVTLPQIQARLASIFHECRASLDFRCHYDWDNEMAVLKREIRAKLDSGSRTAAQTVVSNIAPVQSDAGIAPSTAVLSTAPTTLPISHNGVSQSPATIDLGISPDSVVSQESGSAVNVAAPITSAAGSSSEYYVLKRQLKDWLKPVSFEADMDAYRRQYVPGTREWAVDAIGKQFAGDANVVWLNGAAGVGKSLVAYLAARSPPSGFTLLSAFFCKHYDETKNNAKQLVCKLVYDLA
ncbi:hypothetical protein HDU82_003951, partial [Entophlyctis luteolus]